MHWYFICDTVISIQGILETLSAVLLFSHQILLRIYYFRDFYWIYRFGQLYEMLFVTMNLWYSVIDSVFGY